MLFQKKNKILIALTINMFIFLQLFVVACEDDDQTEDIDVTFENAILTEKLKTEEPPPHGDITPEFIGARWENVGRGEKSGHAAVLHLVLENISNYTIDVSPILECHGLMKYQIDMELGNATIEPGEEKNFMVQASKIPIQPLHGAAQAGLVVEMIVHTDSGPQPTKMATRSFYYFHDDNYGEVTTFDDTHFMKNKGGHLVGFKESPEKNRILGRVARQKGGFQPVFESDFVVKKDGEVIGYETGMDVEIGSEQEIEGGAK